MLGLVGCDFCLMLQGESNVVQALEQATAGELIDLEGGGKSAIVFDLALLQVNDHLVVGEVSCPTDDFRDLLLAQHDREYAVLHAVIGEDVGERRSDHCPETKVRQGPDGVLARRAAAEILSRHKDAGPRVARFIEGKRRVLRTVLAAPPIVKQELAKAGALNSFEELLGNDLVGVNVGAIERSDLAFMNAERLHDPPE